MEGKRKVVSVCETPVDGSPARLLCPWDSLDKKTGVGGHFLLQGIILTQGLNPGLLHCRQILYPSSHWGNLVILEKDFKEKIHER